MKFTVFCVCREQRHAYHVETDTMEEAEKKARKIHDKASPGDILVVAGIAKGFVDVVFSGDIGFEDQMEGKS